MCRICSLCNCATVAVRSEKSSERAVGAQLVSRIIFSISIQLIDF